MPASTPENQCWTTFGVDTYSGGTSIPTDQCDTTLGVDSFPEGPAYQWAKSGIQATFRKDPSYRRSARGTCTGFGARESWWIRPGSEARQSKGSNDRRVFSGRLTWKGGTRHTGGASGPLVNKQHPNKLWITVTRPISGWPI